HLDAGLRRDLGGALDVVDAQAGHARVRRRAAPAGVARVRVAGGEVGCVVVRVRTVAAQVGGRVAEAGGGRGLEVVGRAVADEVADAGGGVAVGSAGQRRRGGDQRDLATGGGHGGRAGRVRRRQRSGPGGAGGLLHQ